MGLEQMLTDLSNTTAVLVMLWYFYGFVTAWVVFTFLRGIGGLEVSLDDFTTALIWPLMVVSLLGLFIRGSFLTYKEYKTNKKNHND